MAREPRGAPAVGVSASTLDAMPVHRPTSADDLKSLVRELVHEGRCARIRGAGRWASSAPDTPREVIETTAMAGIVAYTPEDLTLSCGAGTTLAELDAATRARGQWCPLLPWGDDLGTVGATVATASTGPFAERLGRPRNLVLGLTCVDGAGRVIEAGGRVVKNVAGFDLTRLMTGAWGTLGVITHLHLRLRARPAVDETLVLEGRGEAAAALAAFTRSPYAPLAAHPLAREPRAAMGAVLPAPTDLSAARWLVRLGGNADFVAASRARLREMGSLTAVDGDAAWRVVRAHEGPIGEPRPWRWDALSRELRERFDPQRVFDVQRVGDPR